MSFDEWFDKHYDEWYKTRRWPLDKADLRAAWEGRDEEVTHLRKLIKEAMPVLDGYVIMASVQPDSLWHRMFVEAIKLYDEELKTRVNYWESRL